MNKIFFKRKKIFKIKKKKLLLIYIMFIIFLSIKFRNINKNINRINFDKIKNYSIYDAAKKGKEFLNISIS